MGRLKSTDAIEIAEGVFAPAVKGLLVNGVLLGEPVELDGDPKTYEWDDSALPNGTIDADGVVTDEEGNVIWPVEEVE